MSCGPEDRVNITSCYVPSIDSRCFIGGACSVLESSYNSNCSITGIADQYLTRLIGETFKCFNLIKKCISNEFVAVDTKCDFLFGSNYKNGNLSDDWVSAGTYIAEPVSALYPADIKYGPWDFLAPFSTNMWMLILITMFVLTPLVMSFVEYDEEETIWENFWRFLPDSIHAHMGVDLVNNDLPTKNTSYILSIFVSIFTFVIMTLYASNLTTYVLYKNSHNIPIDGKIRDSGSVYIENSLIYLINSPGAKPISYYEIPRVHASGDYGVIVAEEFFLRSIKTCEEKISPLRAFGKHKYVIVSSKFGDENIKKIKKNVRSGAYITRVYNDLCQTATVKPIKLGGIYGVFILFLAPATLIVFAVIIRRFMFKKSPNPYITNSP